MNENNEQFKQELLHHAADVNPTLNTYDANLAISDFGLALLHGMVWSGGTESVSGGERKSN